MNDAVNDKIAGVLGGMGPDATVDFMAEVVRRTVAERDQDHLHMLVDHNPKVPDRQAAIRGEGGDVGASLAEMARRLEAAGAEFLVMPCNTAHVYANSIRDAVSLPLIDIVDVTVAAVRERRPDATKVGLLATPGCLDTGIYQKALDAAGLETLLPASQDVLMGLILRVKSGERGAAVLRAMSALAGELVAAGANVVIAGCTEIPLVLGDDDIDVPLVSSTAVLAQKTVEFSKNI